MTVAWDIPNVGEVNAGEEALARVFSEDLEAVIAGINNEGVISGLAASAVATLLQLSIAAGQARIGGSTFAITADTLTFAAADASLARLDLVTVVPSTDTISVQTGTPAAAPQPPAIPAGSLLLYRVLVTPTQTNFDSADLTQFDRRVFVVAPPSGTVPTPTSADQLLVPNAGVTAFTPTRWSANVISKGADPTYVSDSAPAYRASRDFLQAQNDRGLIYQPHGKYKFNSGESKTIRGVSRSVGLWLPPKIGLTGEGRGSGRSGGDDSEEHAPTEIVVDSALYAAILAFSTTGNPDWRGTTIEKFHIKDGSPGRNVLDHGILIAGGMNNTLVREVSLSHLEKSTAWAIRIQRADNNQPSQYVRIFLVDIEQCYNGLWVEGNNPDCNVQWMECQRSGLADGPGIGWLIESSKFTARDCEVQFFGTGIFVDNFSDNRGKHLFLGNIHIEGDQSQPADTYAYGFRMRGTAGQKELPVIKNLDFGNTATIAQPVELEQVTDARLTWVRIRDNKWMETTDAEFNDISSTGRLDGVLF